MKSKLIVAALMLLMFPAVLFALNLDPINKNRDGSSQAKAIVLKQRGDYLSSLAQEDEYIETKFGFKGADWKDVKQENQKRDGYIYDAVTILLLDSKKEKVIYFDVTDILK